MTAPEFVYSARLQVVQATLTDPMYTSLIVRLLIFKEVINAHIQW